MTIFLDENPLHLDNGLVGLPWQIETGNPATFFQAISEPDSIKPIRIWAQIFRPDDHNNSPTVIVVPGSLGVAESHIYKSKILTDEGITVCLIDPFGSRGVESTVSDQAQYSFAASAWDVLSTVDQLRDQAGVDPDRIGVQGHSRGGSAALMAASMQKLTYFSQTIAGVYAAYPWCGMQFLDPRVGETKIRSIIGDQDEWCLPQQVQGYMQALRLAGAEATIRIVAGAHHSFDRFSPLEISSNASVAPGAPTIYIKENGVCMHPVNGESSLETDERSLMLYGIKAGYGKIGARIGTEENFAHIFHEDMMAFWQFLKKT